MFSKRTRLYRRVYDKKIFSTVTPTLEIWEIGMHTDVPFKYKKRKET